MSLNWVFGYGSLCWNPGFNFSNAHVGYIKGFKRRFWQGNDEHRGTPEKLGRVVTLIEDEKELTWGKAFQMNDKNASKQYLDKREVALGGYSTIVTTFYPQDKNIKPFQALIYIALPCNPQYLGPASTEEIAYNIATSEGKSGHNVEYLSKLATFMKQNVPTVIDKHLFDIEKECIKIINLIKPSLLLHFDIEAQNYAFVSYSKYKNQENISNQSNKLNYFRAKLVLNKENFSINRVKFNLLRNFCKDNSNLIEYLKKIEYEKLRKEKHFINILKSRKTLCIKI